MRTKAVIFEGFTGRRGMRALWQFFGKPLLALSITVGGLPQGSADDRATAEILFAEELPASPTLIYLHPKIGDRDYRMLLDSGAQVSALSREHVGLALTKVGEHNLSTIAGQTSTRQGLFRAVSMRLQDFSVSNEKVIFLDLDRHSQFLGQKVDGIVGMPELSVGKLFISYQSGRVELHRGPWKISGPSVTEEKLDGLSEVPVFSTKLAGHSCHLLIDTGYDGCIIVDPLLFSILVAEGIIELQPSQGALRGHFGDASIRRGWFRKGELMGKSLDGMRVSAGKSGTHGSVGLGWLCGFNVEIALAEERFRYQEIANIQPPVNLQSMVGAGFAYSGGRARAAKLSPSGPADLAGLKIGDTVESFGSLRGEEINTASLTEFVGKNAGKAIPIRFRRASDGSMVEAVLQLTELRSDWNFIDRTREGTR